MDRRLLWKTRFFLILVILTQPIGNLALTVGMKHRTLTSPLDYVLAIFSPYVALGIVFLVVWLLSRMALLSWADMSYVLPITAIGYIANALLGRFVLQEQVSTTRWMGTVLIAVGTLLVSLTPARTPSVR